MGIRVPFGNNSMHEKDPVEGGTWSGGGESDPRSEGMSHKTRVEHGCLLQWTSSSTWSTSGEKTTIRSWRVTTRNLRLHGGSEDTCFETGDRDRRRVGR